MEQSQAARARASKNAIRAERARRAAKEEDEKKKEDQEKIRRASKAGDEMETD